jgi:hypothetical protein
LDGLQIAHYGLTPDSPATPMLLDGVISECNARQGLSWVGGIGLTVRNSRFNHTGRARFSSAPGAGVDIEAEDSVNRNGLFENCEFINNTGPGLVADSGDSANITVRDSTFWGITNYSIWSNKPFMRFESCDFHGTAIRAYGSRTEPEAATQFVNSSFDDFAHPLYGQPYIFRALVDVEGGDGHNVTFDGCTFTATQSQSLFVLDQDLDDPVVVKNSSFIHQYENDIQATLSGVFLQNVHFSEEFASPPQTPTIIDAPLVRVAEDVVVDGPHVTFLSMTGLIPPGDYFIKKTATFRSTGAQDGWILESGENTARGGILQSSATTFNLGDHSQDKQYRAILSFNTASLPDNAVITKVTLKIKKQGLVGTNPFTILGGLKVDMRKPFFGANAGLVIGDFQAAAGKSAVAIFGATPTSNWYSALLNATGRAYINKTGTTQFRLRFLKDDNDDMSTDYMRFFSGNYATVSAKPTLLIEYYLP